jgi:hypothetical protein
MATAKYDYLHYRMTVMDDIEQIEPNEYFDTASKDFIIQGFTILPTLKAWTVLNGAKIVAIILANEFYKDFYSIGIIVCNGIKFSELKFIKKTIKELVDINGAKYVYSEGETHPVKDRFHEFMGFELEKDLLGKFKKWKLKGTEV